MVAFSASNSANHVGGGIEEIRFPSNVNIAGVLTVGASERDDFQANYSPTSNPASGNNQIIDIVAPSHRAYPGQIFGETLEVWTIDLPGNVGYNPWPTSVGNCQFINPPFVGEQVPDAGVNFNSYTGRFGGTSAACPQVAAVAALVLSVNPNLTQQQVFNILTNSADDVGGYNYTNGVSNELGAGRLNACSAVRQTLSTLPITGPSQFCATETYQIPNLSAGATVTWSATGSISISGSNTANPVSVSKSTDGSGTLTANINTACGSFNVVKNNIQAGNPALPTFISYPASRCVDQPYELTPILPAGTSITAISGLNGGVQEPLVETSYGVYIVPPNVYSIMLTLNNNCGSSTFTRLFPRSNCFSYGYSVYPNPANQTLTIDYQGNTGIEENSSESLMLILEEKQIKLFNDKGTEVKTATIRTGKSKTVLDTRDLPEGTYFLHITEGKETIKKQIIIKH